MDSVRLLLVNYSELNTPSSWNEDFRIAVTSCDHPITMTVTALHQTAVMARPLVRSPYEVRNPKEMGGILRDIVEPDVHLQHVDPHLRFVAFHMFMGGQTKVAEEPISVQERGQNYHSTKRTTTCQIQAE